MRKQHKIHSYFSTALRCAMDVSTVWQILLWVGGASVITHIFREMFSVIQDVSLGERMWFWVGLALLWTGAGLAIAKKFVFPRFNRQYVEFYGDRIALAKGRGTLCDELDKVKSEAWILWHTGTIGANSPIWANTKVKRLLLSNPSAKSGSQKYYLPMVANTFNISQTKLKEDIEYTTKIASPHIQVKWFNGLIGDTMIIAEPNNTKKGWVRIEIATPFPQPNDRPSIIIRQSENPALFKNVVTYYNDMFTNKSEAPQLLSGSIRNKKASKSAYQG